MDFNTGPGSEGGGPRPPRRTGTVSGGAGDDYNLSDPVGSFVRTTQSVLLNPIGFFRGIPRSGNFLSPLVFAIICAVVYGLLAGILNLLFPPEVPRGLQQMFGSDVLPQPGVGSVIKSIILSPVYTAIGLFIGAGIIHLLVLLFARQSNSGYEATFRVLAYVSATQLVSWLGNVPIIGWLISILVLVYTVYIGIVGIREVHSTTTGRAAAVVLMPVAIVVILAIIVGAIVAILAAALSQ